MKTTRIDAGGRLALAAQKPFFRAAVQADGTLELLVYEEIGYDWCTGGGITAKGVKEQIDRARNYTKVLVRINSPGGDVFEGIAIYNLLRAQKRPIEVCVDGIAASAASIIAMAGDEITMGPNAMMMIHNASAICMGFAEDMRKMAEALDKVSTSIAQTYVTKTGKAAEDILALMDAETWMTAQECVDGGFATAIVSDADPEVARGALALARKFKALERLKRVPEKLKAEAAPDPLGPPTPPVAATLECECQCDNCLAGDCADCTNVNCEDPNCTDCPMQNALRASAYEAIVKWIRRNETKELNPQPAPAGA